MFSTFAKNWTSDDKNSTDWGTVVVDDDDVVVVIVVVAIVIEVVCQGIKNEKRDKNKKERGKAKNINLGLKNPQFQKMEPLSLLFLPFSVGRKGEKFKNERHLDRKGENKHLHVT